MAKKVKPVIKDPATPKKRTRMYTLPEQGVVVKATSAKEAADIATKGKAQE